MHSFINNVQPMIKWNYIVHHDHSIPHFDECVPPVPDSQEEVSRGAGVSGCTHKKMPKVTATKHAVVCSSVLVPRDKEATHVSIVDYVSNTCPMMVITRQ